MSSTPLEARNNPTIWDDLLRRALPALDHVFPRDVDPTRPPYWTLGGGTALALRIGHRLSDDIDLFVPTRPLKDFTPSRNPGAKSIGAAFQWPGHYLKFECGVGEIDFLSPHLQTEPGYTLETYRGRRVALETTDEVIVKKIRYRSGSFTARDIFDLASVGRIDPNLARVLATEVADALPRLEAVIAARQRVRGTLKGDVRPTPAFEDLVGEAYDAARAIVKTALDMGPPSRVP